MKPETRAAWGILVRSGTSAMASLFGVSGSTVRQIRSGKRWGARLAADPARHRMKERAEAGGRRGERGLLPGNLASWRTGHIKRRRCDG